MPDHWNFILEHVRGDYVRFLCDDDAMLPRGIQMAAEVFESHPKIDAVIQGYGSYVHPQAPPGEVANTLEVKRPSASILSPDRNELLGRLIAGETTIFVPTLLNGFTSLRCIHEIKKRAGPVCLPPACDYGFASLFIFSNYEWKISRATAWLWGKHNGGSGLMTFSGRCRQNVPFLKELRVPDFYKNQMIPTTLGPTFLNAVVSTAAELMGIDLDIDICRRYLEQFRSLEYSESMIGFTPERGVLLESLEALPGEQRGEIREFLRSSGIRGMTPVDRVSYFLKRVVNKNRSWLRALTDRYPLLQALKTTLRPTLRPLDHKDGAQVRGADYGISNMFEATRKYGEIERSLYGPLERSESVPTKELVV